MLQIISGKFFESDSIEVSDCKGILYSNFYWILPIETCIGTLEPVDVFNTSSISPYVINYKNKIERLPPETTVRTGDSEIINQFKLLCIFGLKSFFDVDRNYVELLCREHPKSSTENIMPSNFVPRFFDHYIHGKYEETEDFKKFIDKVIGLPRKRYLAVINSINAFSQSLQTLNYNLDLAYSLMIYSLESLSQRFDEFNPTWNDYDQSVRKKLDELFEKEKLKQDTVSSIQDILLDSTNLRVMLRFTDFTSRYVSDSFFKEEACESKTPLRKSELKEALKNAYKMRSSYVHELEEIEDSVKISPQFGGGESIRWENNPYLTYSGLTRLVHHVICNFIQEQEYLEKEKYNWRQDLPGRHSVNIHPMHWIWDENIFTLSDINITFSGFLSILIDWLFLDKKLVDLRNLMLKIEKLVNGGLRDKFKSPLISFYFLYNNLMNDNFKSPNYDDFIKNYTELIFEPNIENMITILLLNKKWPWNIEKSVDHYLKYRINKFNRNSLNIPHYFEVFIIINIANEFLEQGNKEEFKKWLDNAILELPGKSECQNIIKEYKSKEEKIIILDTFKDCIKEKKT
ncbi:hypothetical protein [Methanobacterium sp.]|uniref:hypothetical protein n=1 Tax=Methanobacterium sp. TaxID=2164 RepID=UPI003C76B942